MNHSKTLAVLTAAALVAVTACRSSGSRQEPPLEPPAGLQARSVPGEFDFVAVGWSAPWTGDGLQIQVRRETGAWVTQPYLIPSSSAVLVLALPPDAPEATTYGFRVRTVRGEQTTDWSAEVSFLRGVRPAGALALHGVWDPYLGSVLTLTWTRRSAVADRVTLERQIQPPSRAAGPWTPIAVAADATGYQDVNPPGWVDFARCAYRVTYWAGGVPSEPVEVLSDEGGLASPRDLVAEVTSGTDVHVSWTNASTAATRIDVRRWKRGVYDPREWTLPPDATSVDDPGLTPGVYGYVVQAFSSTGSGHLSSPAQIAVVVPAASHASTYPARIVTLPIGSAVARLADGAFAVGLGTQNTGTYPSYAFAPEDGAWDRFATPGGTSLAIPGPLVDPAGGVHVIYLEEVWDGATQAPVRHVWHDGSGWHVEYVGLASRGRASTAIAADGSVRAMWRLEDGQGFAYATNASGAFVVEEVRPAAGAPVTIASALALDGGTPRVLVVDAYSTPARTWLVSRDGGAWAAELVPGATTRPDGTWSLVAGGGTLGWIYPTWNGLSYDLWLRERNEGGWGAEELLVAATPTLPLPGIGAVRSPDGTRIALALPGRDFPYPMSITRLAVRDGGGTTVTDLLPSAAGAQVGFTPEGKIWLVDGLEIWAGGAGTVGPCVLYEEP